MKSGLPKFRGDLLFSEQDTAGGTSCVVQDPVTGESFRFRPPETFIARQLDGATPLETVRRRVAERFGAPLPAPQLADFLADQRFVVPQSATVAELGEIARHEAGTVIAPVIDLPCGSNRSISLRAPLSSSPIARTVIASPLMVTSRK